MSNVYIDNIITTDRLIVKVLDESSADKVLNYFLRNKNFLERWEAVRDKDYYTLGFQRNTLISEMKKIKEGMMYKLWIYKKGDDKKLIGSISFNNIIRGCFHSCHLGYRLDKDEINNGYMTEGLKESINFVFTELKLHRIEANIMPRNKKSLRVVEKLGFYNEGLAKKYLKINGKWEDHIHMVLLNEDLE